MLQHLNPEWFDRYVHRFEMARFPKQESKQLALRRQVGQDVHQLLQDLACKETPEALRQEAVVMQLRQVFEQHYEQKEGSIQWRDGPAVHNEDRLISPYDPQARSSRKRDLIWLGYKVHLTETCDQDPQIPHLIVQVHTTPATSPDSSAVAPVMQQLRAQGLAPSTLLVDQGYTSAASLVEQGRQGTNILGPVSTSTSWQEQEKQGYGLSDFTLDWSQQRARCPQGHLSGSWKPVVDRHGTDKFEVRIPAKTCLECPIRELCTHGAGGRILKILPQQEYQALEQRRQEQSTTEFRKAYARRAGIEGTISQAVRSPRMRRTPYCGEQKTHLHHLQIAAGLNALRIVTHLQHQAQDQPSRPQRSESPFARLKKQAIA